MSPTRPQKTLSIPLQNGSLVTVVLRPNARAKRLTLRSDGRRDWMTLTHPPKVSQQQLHSFLNDQRAWMEQRQASRPPPRPFADGATIPIEGQDHRIIHSPGLRRPPWCENGHLYITGQPEHLARRVRDFLRKRADQVMREQVLLFAQKVNRPVGRITLRDSKTRWGSCSARGDISLCWRLICAPPDVLSYVIAHEVAHLVEMNHSPRFWAIVQQIFGDHTGQKAWLKRHGRTLHCLGLGDTPHHPP